MEEHSKGPSHNNPEEAAKYVRSVNSLLQSFVTNIPGFDRYKHLDAWETFLQALSQLLSKLDSAYFTKMDTEVILDTIPDMPVTLSLHILKKQQTEYSNVFPVARYQQVLKLYPKCAYKEMYHVLIRGESKLSPNYSELKFDKERLTPEEITEENCCNLILPRPFHPKFAKIDFKDPTRCLAAAAHFLIRKKLFNSKCTQLHVAKDFAAAEKKLHLAISGRKYDPGKKASKRKLTSDVKTADPKPSTSQDESVSEQ